MAVKHNSFLTSVVLVVLFSDVAISQLQWTSQMTQLNIPENTTVGTEVARLQASGAQGSVTYSVNSTILAVDPSSGAITLQSALDYNARPSFSVRFIATDSNNATNQIFVDVSVMVTPVGNNSVPTFDLNSYQFSVVESVTVGSVVYDNIEVSDRDAGLKGTLTMSCQSPDDLEACTTFNISVRSIAAPSYFAQIVLARALDYTVKSSYSMRIIATDGGNPPLSSSAMLSVTVKSKDDMTPNFINSPIIFAIPNHQPNGTVMASVKVTTGPQKAISMRITNDTFNYFTIGQTVYNPLGYYEAQIISNGQFDYQQVRNLGRQYVFFVTAYVISEGQTTSISGVINITATLIESNNNPPIFQPATYDINVPVNTARGSLLPSLSMLVNDADVGPGSFFILSATTSPAPATDIFGVSPTQGDGSTTASLIVWKPEYLSYSAVFVVTVTARNNQSSGLGLSGQATVNVHISPANNKPYFTQLSYVAAVRDDSPVARDILTVSALDTDAEDINHLTYSIQGEYQNLVTIDPVQGTIRLADKLNYTATPVLYYTAIVKDRARFNDTAQVTITLVNSKLQGPTFRKEYWPTYVTELTNNLLPPILVYASPLQHDRVIAYYIAGGNEMNLFYIDPNNGNFSMVRGVDTLDTPNRTGIFVLTIGATDQGLVPENSTTSVVVNVIDTNNHAPYFTNVSVDNISEDTPIGDTIGFVKAVDLDTGLNAEIRYIVGPGGRDNFGVDGPTGTIYIAPNADLAYDNPPTYYNLTVYAVDHGSPQQTGTTVVRITVAGSQRPYFQSHNYIFYVTENSPVGHLVSFVNATVLRATTNPTNIVYSIVPDSINGTNSTGSPVSLIFNNVDYTKTFNILSSSGAITIGVPPKYNDVAVYYFQVLANNTLAGAKLRKTDTANVTVFIVPGSRPPVGFLTPSGNTTIYVSIVEEMTIGSGVVNLMPYDAQNASAVFNYRLLPGSDMGGYLALNPTSGSVTVGKRIDYENATIPKQITLNIEAYEPSFPGKNASVTYIFTVQDINDNVPIFSQPSYRFTVYNNATTGYPVGIVNAVDGDSGIFGAIRFAISSGDPNGYFTIDEMNGTITVAKNLSALSTSTFTLSIRANDNPGTVGNRNFAFMPVTIIVADVSSAGTGIAFPGAPYNYYTTESTPTNSTVGMVNAIDYLQGYNITYMIVGGNDEGLFAINPRTGEIIVNHNLTNAGRSEAYHLNISAEAQGSPPRIGFTIVDILILTRPLMNSTKPFFISPADGQIFVIPKIQPSYEVTTVAGNFINTTGATRIFYYFYDNGTNVTNFERLSIDPLTGKITFNGTGYTYNEKDVYRPTLIIRDNGQPPRSSDTRIITVSVHVPKFEACSLYADPLVVYVNKTVELATVITTLRACSPAKNEPIYYYIIGSNSTISSGNGTQNMFVIKSPTSGVIFTNVYPPLNTSSYALKVVAFNQEMSDPVSAANVTGSQLNVLVIVLDQDASGPSFSGFGGVGSNVVLGLRDFTTFGEPIVRMTAGDGDVLPQNRQNKYRMGEISFTGEYSQETDVKAFTINETTGDVYPALKNYRPYSYGYFKMKIFASDNLGRQDESDLTLHVVQASDEARNTFVNRRPYEVRSSTDDVINNVKNQLSANYDNQPSDLSVSQSGFHYYIDPDKTSSFGKRKFLDRPYIDRRSTDVCFYVIKDQQLLDYDSNSDVFGKVNVSGAQQCSNATSCTISRCYPHLTTHRWSGYMWTWWWLIALALLIFIIGVLLIIGVCCVAAWSEGKYNKNQMYVFLDGPSGPPVSEF